MRRETCVGVFGRAGQQCRGRARSSCEILVIIIVLVSSHVILGDNNQDNSVVSLLEGGQQSGVGWDSYIEGCHEEWWDSHVGGWGQL